MACFIDTNIFLRVMVKANNKSFEESLKFLELVKTRKIEAVTSNLNLIEVEWVLRSTYKVKKEDIVNQLEYIDNLSIIPINTYWNQTAIENYKNHKIKFVDSQIASIPQIAKKEWIVVSYDKDFDKLGTKRLEPGEVIKKFE